MTEPVTDFTGNSLGIISDSAILSVGQILFGGTLATGNSATVRITISGTPHDYTQSVISGDTLYTVIARLITQINGCLGSSGITASLANPVVPMLAIAPLRNGNPLPTIAAFVTGAMTASIVSQPQDQLDANPVFYVGHVNPLAPPQPGDSVALEQRVGPDTDHPTQRTIAYGWTYTQIVDPNLATVQGAVTFGTAAPKPTNGYVAPVFKISRGIQIFDSDGAFPVGGDKGYGTINLPSAGGLYIDGVRIDQRAAFTATMAAAQAGIPAGVVTKVNFTVAGAQVGVNFDTVNSRWTPPAGMVRFSASLLWQAMPANSYVYIAKNGAAIRGSDKGNISALDYASGSDYYDVRVLLGSSVTLDGQPMYSWFEGSQI